MNRSDKLLNDLQSVINDAEELFKNSGLPTSEDFKSAKERFEATLKRAKDEAIRVERMVVDKTKEVCTTTDNYVKDHPWQAVGLGASVGLVIGLLIGRK